MSMDIVVGVDESAGAADALRWAVREAEVRGGTVKAVLAWGWFDQHPLDGEPFDPEFHETQAAARLEAIVRRHLGEHPPDLDLLAVNEFAVAALLGASAGADLLVVGARGMGGFKGLLLGSVSHSCLRHARCPVAVVKHRDDPPAAVRTIVVGIDGSRTAEHALAWAAEAARAHRARLAVVHAWHPSVVIPADPYVLTGLRGLEEAAQEVLDDAVASVDGHGMVDPVEARLVVGTAGRAVLDAAEDADLVVVGSRQQGPAGSILLGSTSIQVTHHAPCPVVVVPRP
jgi:nucleotide-binding universal stress UspA family protein